MPTPHKRLDDAALQELTKAFHALHMREYTFQLDSDVELVNFHIVVFADIDKKQLPPLPVTGRALSEAQKGVRKVDFGADGVHDTNEYDLSLIEPGMKIAGPAVLEDPTATIVISPGKRAHMDDYGNIHIQMRAS